MNNKKSTLGKFWTMTILMGLIGLAFFAPIPGEKAFAQGPITWTFCANENGTCTFSGIMTVRYGAGSSWYYQVATSSIACNNATFGDPLYGTVKACYYSPNGPTPTPLPPTNTPTVTPTPDNTWIYCAPENGICTFTGTMNVRYGYGSSWYYQVATNSIACNNATFGDPLVGMVKACYYSYIGPTPTPGTVTPTPDISWIYCAPENGICTFTGTTTVRYGAGSAWYYQVATGSIPCNNATFGDPLVGTVKACYYSSSELNLTPTSTSTFIATSTSTSTSTPTLTLTRTLIPIIADFNPSYSRLLLLGPDIDVKYHSQTLTGTLGGSDYSFNVTVYVYGPNNYSYQSEPINRSAGSFNVDKDTTGNPYFGCDKVGSWWAYYHVIGTPSGTQKDSNEVYWYVGMPQAHGAP